MAIRVFRGIQRLNRVLNTGIRMLHPTFKCASSQTRIVTGSKNEKIIIPSAEVSYPETLIHEFIWNNSESYPNHIALECGISGKKYTYAQAKDATSYIGRSLWNMGLKKDDIVALVAPNFPDTILSFIGSSSAGLVITNVNPLYTVEEISRQLLQTNAKAIITSTAIARSTVLAASKTSFPHEIPIIVIDDKTGSIPEGLISFDDLIIRGKSLPPVPNLDRTCDDVAVLLFSSGTTGLPKGVMLTHRNLVSNIVMFNSTINAFHSTTNTYQEVIPALLPFFHVYGMNTLAFTSLSCGAKVITIPKFMPETFFNVLEKNKTTVLFIVPPIVLFLTSSPFVKKHYFEHTHTVLSGAAPLAETDIKRFYEKYSLDPNVLKFHQGYGLTESLVAFIELGQKYASIGQNLANCQARLVDIKTQQDISNTGQTGELWIKGPHIMKGYLNNESATRDTLTEDGWLKTGDVAYFDKDFDFYITDRLKELIKVKGYQVPPAELEALLRMHPDVEEAAVIGIPHARYGEVPKAFVTVKKGKKPTEDDIKNFVKEKVSDYKQLKGGVTFIDNIPKSPSGKILRAKLK